MVSELFAKLTDLVDRGDTAGCVVAVKDASNAADLEEDSDEILALVVHSDLQGGPLGCTLHLVDIKLRVALCHMEVIL